MNLSPTKHYNAALAQFYTEYRDSKGRPHREDGPARVWDGGTCLWYLHGSLHRVGGPAFYESIETRRPELFLKGKLYNKRVYHLIMWEEYSTSAAAWLWCYNNTSTEKHL